MGILVHLHNPFDPLKRDLCLIDRPTTVRRLVQRHKGLRRHTSVYRPGGVYGRRRVREFTRPTICLLNGKALPRTAWKTANVGHRDVVMFYAAPLGGGGGSNPLAIVGAVVAVIATVVLQQWYLPALIGPTLLGSTTLAGVASSVGATLIVGAASYGLMALFARPALPQQRSVNMDTSVQSSPTYNLALQGNTARLENPIPELIGKHRIFPDFVGQPYTRYVDQEQFIHMGLGISIGEVEVDADQIKVGDTKITSFEEIDYVIVGPGGDHDDDIWDPRWVPSPDIATIMLPGDENIPASPWKGPFAANPPGTVIHRIEFDLIAPRGLQEINTSNGNILPQAFEVEVEIQEIDDDGTAVGAWTALDIVDEGDLTTNPRRYTYGYDTPAPGRWQLRMRRNDTMGLGSNVNNEVQWVGLRGHLVGSRKFAGMTTMGVKMRATGDLQGANSRKVNVVATRMLPTYDDISGQMTTVLSATRNPCDAFAYIARSSNGGRIPDDRIDLAGLYAWRDFFDEEGWSFDFVFDQSLTVSEALGRVARAVVAERVVQGGKLRLVRDVEAAAPVMMFGPRNIRRGSVETLYAMVDETTADSLVLTYIDPVTWKPKDVTIAFDDSEQTRPSRLTAHGITDRTQARTVGWWFARQNRYRRTTRKFATEMEGGAVLYGDAVSFSMDFPNCGQTMEVLAWDEDTLTMTLSDPPVFTDGATHYVAVRDSKGQLAGPFEATAVADAPYQLVVADSEDLPEILTGGDRERTFIQFGAGEAYARQTKVKQVTPRSEEEFEVVVFDDDPRMYEAIPADDEPEAIEYEDVVVHIDANDSDVNLRTLANLNGFLGVHEQDVTIYVDLGVEVSATGTSQAAMIRGSWPAGYTGLTLINLGTISGAGGAGGPSGNSGTHAGGLGSIGGTALDVSTGPITVNNAAGTIRAGGGGGGGGAVTAGTVVDDVEPLYGGGGGGGGQGNAGGAAGAAASSGLTGAGSNGTAGTSGAAGTGGAGASWLEGMTGFDAPAGGDGGTWGEEGEPGEDGATGGVVRPGGTGGAPGKAVKGNSNITWSGTGTIIGAIV